jgi:hypothetical protein
MSMPLSNTPVGPHHRVERVAVYGRPREETPAPQPSTVELLAELIARVDAAERAAERHAQLLARLEAVEASLVHHRRPGGRRKQRRQAAALRHPRRRRPAAGAAGRLTESPGRFQAADGAPPTLPGPLGGTPPPGGSSTPVVRAFEGASGSRTSGSPARADVHSSGARLGHLADAGQHNIARLVLHLHRVERSASVPGPRPARRRRRGPRGPDRQVVLTLETTEAAPGLTGRSGGFTPRTRASSYD